MCVSFLFLCAEFYCAGGHDKQIPLLRDVFDAFPNTPINVDIKVNNDTLIKKVYPYDTCMHFVYKYITYVHGHASDMNKCNYQYAKKKITVVLLVQVSELVIKYDREHLTVWGNSSNQIVKKCYKEVNSLQMHCLV